MLDGSNIQDLDLSAVPSRRRNPIVADIFGRLGLMEREGSGLNKIMRFYKAANNYDERKSPAFYSDRTLFRVIFYNLNYMPQMEGYAQQDVPPSVPPSVSPSDQQNPLEPLILGMMMANPHITRQEMAGHIKKSVKTVSRIISNMSNVRYVGSKSTGHWEIDD
jgi:ATP-dependent DNA helicase RecG